MDKIKLITDSLSDIPKEIAEELNIKILPLTVRFGKEEYKDNVNITTEEFYNKIQVFEEIPTTSQVPPMEFKKAIEEALMEGYDKVIIINGSGKVSGTHQSAVIASEEISNNSIYVFDSGALAYGCGMIVVEVAKMIKNNQSFQEIMDRINVMIKGAEQIFSVDTLKYLHKNGRLSTTKMALGTLLNVKPVLGIIKGKVEPLDKVRGNKKSIKRMIEICRERGVKEGAKIGLGHASNLEGLDRLREEIVKEVKPSEITVTDVGSTIGCHAGPGTLAIYFINEENGN